MRDPDDTIDELLQENDKLAEDLTYELYIRHVLEADLLSIRQEFANLVSYTQELERKLHHGQPQEL